MANKVLTDGIQTGRNVYVDVDKYKADTKYASRIDQCVAEGFLPIAQTPEEALAAILE